MIISDLNIRKSRNFIISLIIVVFFAIYLFVSLIIKYFLSPVMYRLICKLQKQLTFFSDFLVLVSFIAYSRRKGKLVDIEVNQLRPILCYQHLPSTTFCVNDVQCLLNRTPICPSFGLRSRRDISPVFWPIWISCRGLATSSNSSAP